MSPNSTTDEPNQRLSRLKAMQNRRKDVMGQGAAEAAPVAPASEAGAPADVLAPSGGGRAALIQKVRKFISLPEGGIDKKKAKALVQFIKRQASDPNAPRHEQAKKAMAAVNNMDPEVRRKLLSGAEAGGAKGADKGAGGGAKRGALGGGKAGARGGAGALKVVGPDAGTSAGGSWFDELINKI